MAPHVAASRLYCETCNDTTYGIPIPQQSCPEVITAVQSRTQHQQYPPASSDEMSIIATAPSSLQVPPISNSRLSSIASMDDGVSLTAADDNNLAKSPKETEPGAAAVAGASIHLLNLPSTPPPEEFEEIVKTPVTVLHIDIPQTPKETQTTTLTPTTSVSSRFGEAAEDPFSDKMPSEHTSANGVRAEVVSVVTAEEEVPSVPSAPSLINVPTEAEEKNIEKEEPIASEEVKNSPTLELRHPRDRRLLKNHLLSQLRSHPELSIKLEEVHIPSEESIPSSIEAYTPPDEKVQSLKTTIPERTITETVVPAAIVSEITIPETLIPEATIAKVDILPTPTPVPETAKEEPVTITDSIIPETAKEGPLISPSLSSRSPPVKNPSPSPNLSSLSQPLPPWLSKPSPPPSQSSQRPPHLPHPMPPHHPPPRPPPHPPTGPELNPDLTSFPTSSTPAKEERPRAPRTITQSLISTPAPTSTVESVTASASRSTIICPQCPATSKTLYENIDELRAHIDTAHGKTAKDAKDAGKEKKGIVKGFGKLFLEWKFKFLG
ncbi:hypothetical protein L873DRAFT_1843342 [Choiromyces venosus 120613-1]|uniref:Uncharacterized protein n=1 Tax=Choiromyces venosus 120613-1 TaxID=1336337 RepID=A0A3N4JNS9_9PEZI|nr:hypothetical protein L873DRAFT_1843342 [Choiromyces venosus 120613-1]